MKMEENYSFIPKELDENKWEKRREEDNSNFLKSINVAHDKRGIIGEELFELTLDNQNAKLGYRQVLIQSGDNSAKGMLNALCPELESFVTIINWMGTSTDRNKERLNYHHKLESYLNEKNHNNICVLKGNYRIKNEEYSTITLFRADVEIKRKEKQFYEWERVPFLKRSSETFGCFSSPIFMSSIKSGEDNVSEDKVYYFSAPFIIKEVSLNKLKVLLISTTNPYQTETEVYINDSKIIERLKKELNHFYLGLFEEKIFRKNKEFVREYVLLNTSLVTLDGNELIAHLITQRMYYTYLKNLNLKICSDQEFNERLKTIAYQPERNYGLPLTMKLENFCKIYLDAFFINLGGYWYYKPHILKNLKNEDFLEFIDYLNSLENKADTLKVMKLSKKYYQYKDQLYFLNNYNHFSKRTLIDRISSHKSVEGVWKWAI